MLLLCAALSAWAQTKIPLFGTVQDAVLKRPIWQAKVSILTADSVVVMDSVPLKKKTNDKGVVTKAEYFASLKSGKYLVRATLDGYTDAWQQVDLTKPGSGFFYVPALELRRERTVKMNEVEITATLVKMYYRGDTLIYNASDFQLPDGSMLDDLIRQLPGVTMTDAGEIFVHGRKVEELQLGSRSFFRGNSKVLLENLPYYTVRNIKVYEQDTDKNRAAGYAIEKKKFVMDVNLKPEYNRGLIGNLEAAGGTHERYLGRGFLLGFTDPYRFSLMGNSNNVNEKQHIGQSSSWNPATRPQSLLTSHSVAGEISYQSADKEIKNDLTAEFTSTKNETEMRQRRELFLDGLIPVQNRHASDLTRANKISVKNHFRRAYPRFFDVDVNYAHNSYSGDAHLLSEQFNDTLVTRMREEGMNDGRSWNAHFGVDGMHFFNKEKDISLNYKLHVTHNDEKIENAKRFMFEKPLASNQYNSSEYRKQLTKVAVDLGNLNIRLPKEYYLNLSVLNYAYDNQRLHDHLYHPDTLLLPSQLDALQAITDRNNSYDNRLDVHKLPMGFRLTKGGYIKDRIPSMNYDFTRDYFIWELQASVTPLHRELDYQRGSLDTLAVQNRVNGNVSFRYKLYPKKNYKKLWEFMAVHFFSATSIFDAINYRDDSQPLVVKLGNPDLKGNQSSLLIIDYKRRKDAVDPNYHFKLTGAYYYRRTAQSVTYNPRNGQYIYRPVNVSGNSFVKTDFDFSYALDKKNRWTWQTNAYARFDHSVDHALMEGMTASQENAVSTLTLNENTYVQYSKDKLNLRAEANAMWRHSEGRMTAFSTLNAVDYDYGLSGRYTLPFGLTVATDLKMYSRRGYGSSLMNTDNLVWNTSLSQSFLKGKLVAGLEAFDLLHQLSNTQYSVNAQGRIETWNRSLPNYVMLHLQWMFNKNPKKK